MSIMLDRAIARMAERFSLSLSLSDTHAEIHIRPILLIFLLFVKSYTHTAQIIAITLQQRCNVANCNATLQRHCRNIEPQNTSTLVATLH